MFDRAIKGSSAGTNRVHAGAIYELLTLAEGIPTDPANRTRFGYVIGRNTDRYVFDCRYDQKARQNSS